MFKKSTIISLCFFFILMFLTPIVKNNTRIIEKNIYKLNHEILVLEKQLTESKIDFIYLSSPERLRENLSKFSSSKIEDTSNISVNETLSRTIITSVTTLLALISIFVLGGAILRGFSLAMIIGNILIWKEPLLVR